MDNASLIPTRFEALMMVRNQFGTEQEMADFFSVTQPTVWRWLNVTKRMPCENGECLRAEELPSPIPAYWLRPDVYRRPDANDRRGAARFLGVDTRAQRMAG
jgi:hypothetical protein